jgi:hypothetical protein
MKRFIYLFISILLCVSLTSAAQGISGKSKVITLQSTSGDFTSASLKASAGIISARLKLYGLNSTEVTFSEDKGQITVNLPDNAQISDIEGLLTSQGQMAFYATYTPDEIAGIFKPNDPLSQILKSTGGNSTSDPRVGCIGKENKYKADELLKTRGQVSNCRLLWGIESKKSEYCLFALKTSQYGRPLLERSDIESVKTVNASDPKEHLIQIKLTPTATGVFEKATRDNLNKAIAVVIDDKVYSWPVVRSVIEGGEVEISGNFTENEVKYFPVIFNTEQLPVSFKIVK